VARITESADVGRLDVEALIELCQDGDEAARDELDRRGVVAPVVADPLPTAMERSVALGLVGCLVGRRFVALEVDKARTATLRFEGGVTVILPAAGGLFVEGMVWPSFEVSL
jgi:hypothetical protein